MKRPPTSVDGGTPMQRDPATTIYERSVEGRRAATMPDAISCHGIGSDQQSQRIERQIEAEQPAAKSRRRGDVVPVRPGRRP